MKDIKISKFSRDEFKEKFFDTGIGEKMYGAMPRNEAK